MQLKPTVTPSDITNDQLTWTSSDESVATVSKTGLVTAKKSGTVTITCKGETATEEWKEATCKIVVRNRIVNSLAFTASKQVMEYGKQTTLQLNPTVTPSDITNDQLTWTSSNESVATVSNTGLVTAKKTGAVTITCKGETATEEWKEATCDVIIANQLVDNIRFDVPANVIQGINKTLQLDPIISPTTVKREQLAWTSSDEDIALVSEDGLVTGKNYGTATITCSGINANGEGVSASCRVTVYKNGLIYVGNIFYGISEDVTYAFVTNCAGGEPSDLEKERYEYSGTVNVPAAVTYDGNNLPVKKIGPYARVFKIVICHETVFFMLF